MRIIINGEKVPVHVRTNRDILIALRSMAKTLKWRIRYDAANEAVYLFSQHAPVSGDISALLSEFPQSESTRLSGKVICLDPGHGGSDSGSIGPSGTMEKDNTLTIALLLKDLLESHGATVVMTRDSDVDAYGPGASAGEEFGARVDTANESGADILISIHNDSFTNSSVSGTTTFHYGGSESVSLAGCVQKHVVEELGGNDRGVRFGSFYVIRYAAMPSILVEVAFISNPEEELLLASDDGRCKIAKGIFEGIIKYFKV
jgi:N-acetylmuramoyl-L-alanine amidase